MRHAIRRGNTFSAVVRRAISSPPPCGIRDRGGARGPPLPGWRGAAVSIFEILREHVPLDLLVSTNGSGKARCVSPNHQDTNPSMHRNDKHVHCYGCGFHGDVVDVWAAIRGFDRPIDAAFGLAGEYGIKLPEIGSE